MKALNRAVCPGVAASSVEGDFDRIGSDTRLGFSGSSFFRFELSSWFSIQPELGWTSKGGQGEINVTYIPPVGPPTPQTIAYPFERRIDYLEIPVLMRFGPPSASAFEPFLVAGPQVGFPTGSDLETDFVSTVSAGARVQMASRPEGLPVFELLPVEPECGLTRLPEPSPGDFFFDIEGDPFVGHGGLEYLLGFVTLTEAGHPVYQCRWSQKSNTR